MLLQHFSIFHHSWNNIDIVLHKLNFYSFILAKYFVEFLHIIIFDLELFHLNFLNNYVVYFIRINDALVEHSRWSSLKTRYNRANNKTIRLPAWIIQPSLYLHSSSFYELGISCSNSFKSYNLKLSNFFS